jgi:protocatechuate 3,4-dioxygenase beta subunit
MKTITLLVSFTLLFGTSNSFYAQQSDAVAGASEDSGEYFPFNDYTQHQLSNTFAIPGHDSKPEKLKITGTIFKNDGVTPASNVILYIEQADEYGDFDLRGEKKKRYVHNRGWVKTDADGQYTFYTYVPGGDRRFNQKQQLFPIIKEPHSPAYHIPSFLFDQDPLLTKACRKRMVRKGDPDRILKPRDHDGMLTVQKDIILHKQVVAAN